ncbi:hypothetical protein CORC01_11445 [Colletotrichum orchidophilum]|uniref:Uncharacterized protein n=1 Tax=Colletotrichum orchidophilum TaxID=1209926 RepID=A0A1G4AVL7_9PEZI|nr:uncharacterized protein CORC01_11445 [Colletotrichum orchidophilum]OHE93220.1 hypothetical protein CORC01_11445 [Colletotrichum orchidophilum]
MKPTPCIAAFAGIISFAAAVPPACLLAALGQQRNPASIDDLCTDLMPAMLGNLTISCQSANLKDAYNAYASTCIEIGVKVDDLPSASTTSAAATSTPGASGNPSPDATPTPSSATTTDGPQESKPSAAGAIAPHAVLFTVLGLSATGLVSIVFL